MDYLNFIVNSIGVSEIYSKHSHAYDHTHTHRPGKIYTHTVV